MRIRHRGREPKVHPDAHVAPTATVVGNVEIAAHARARWTDRIRRTEHATRIRSAEFSAHHDDEAVPQSGRRPSRDAPDC
ncbi:hypothetical protein [Pseudonocardia adelaidensis]|uniref:Uncharacterized protein n=1 Tax=Pseudonocardia adelaidensis TaxID=648754 RepID=A0ABP9NKU3_9PSEU